ncbi:hypothetical protein Tco_1239347, partial [Tanacetum coccineum]
VALFPTMQTASEPSTLPSRITSSPSYSPSPSPEPSFEHSPDHTTTAVSQPSPTQPSTGAEQHIPTPNELPLHAVHSHGSDEGSLKLNELTDLVTKLFDKIGVLEADLKKTKKSYNDEDIADDSSKQGRKLSDVKVQEKASNEIELVIQDVTPTEVIHDQESSEKGQSEVSTAGATKGTASEVLVVSTADEKISTAGRTITYRRRSEEERTRKDKGKAIMKEPEPKKKSKKELEQERLSLAEAIRLQGQMDEAQKAQIARDEEIARQWEEEERPIFERVWDFNQHIEPMDVEHGSEKIKSPKKIEEEDVDTQKEMKEVSKESGAKRKKSIPRKSTRSKRQKMEEDDEKEELTRYLDIIPKEDVPIEVESLSTKGDGSSKNYKVLSEILEDFDRQDVEELYRLVKEKYSASRPEGYDLMLWGDLHTLFEPDEEDELWKNQHEYNNGIAIHMLTEKKYPISQDMISKMLKKKLEVDHECSQAFELLRALELSFSPFDFEKPFDMRRGHVWDDDE